MEINLDTLFIIPLLYSEVRGLCRITEIIRHGSWGDPGWNMIRYDFD